MKPGRIVILLAGRFAGKKAIIVKQQDDGKKDKKFAHALVAGIERNALKVTRNMSQKKIERRSKVKPFVKIVNYNHLMPTRYTVAADLDLKNVVNEEKLSNKETRKQLKRELRKLFNDKYNNPAPKSDKTNHVGFFFRKLRF
jgi:large subunit ribosomal protein L27e